ncbi:MAG: GtrA family protein [Paludibacteraceae bacterium]
MQILRQMNMLALRIRKIIDWLYVPFRRWCSEEFFRYGVCGAGNMVLDWVLYFLVYNFVLRHRMLDLGFVTLSSHIAALCIVFPVTLFTGFWLNKYVTFTRSTLHGGRQLIRYISIVVLNLAVNYFGLKLLVDVCGVYPTPSKMIITVITVAISYFGQKYFSFRK